jgi:hypothetical protein
MDMILSLLGFAFSFFFVLLSYWKEDKFLNVIGTISLFIMAMIVASTNFQTTVNEVAAIQTLSNATGNFTVYSYAPRMYTNGVFAEGLGIGLLVAVFSAVQYLYFSMSFKESA